MGIAAVANVTRMAVAIINSSSVKPAFEGRRFRCWTISIFRDYVKNGTSLVDVYRAFAGDELDGLLLRVACIHFHDGKLGIAGCQTFHHDSNDRPRAVHSR